MNDIVRVMKAADFAARKHTEQKRKGDASEPYVNHLVGVALLVAEATDGEPDAVVAALLHDVVEDQNVKIDEIAGMFGSEVASLVAEVTDDKRLAKQVRKDMQIETAPHKSDIASLIKLADKTSNLRALADSPPDWPIEQKREYVRWARAVVSGLPNKPPALLALFGTRPGGRRAASRSAQVARTSCASPDDLILGGRPLRGVGAPRRRAAVFLVYAATGSQRRAPSIAWTRSSAA